jgi:hypothetical protein
MRPCRRAPLERTVRFLVHSRRLPSDLFLTLNSHNKSNNSKNLRYDSGKAARVVRHQNTA